jgi:hypothetical protein
MSTDRSLDPGGDLLRRLAPLAGVLYAGLSIAGDFAIGPFPEGTTSGTALRTFYVGHGPHVALGGALLECAAVCFGVFGVALWARMRGAVPSVVTGLVLLGAAVETSGQLQAGSFYSFLGEHGADGRIAPAALQAWQLATTEIGSVGGQVVLVLGLLLAAFASRALPRWIAAAGAVVVTAEFTSFGFAASLVFLGWAAATGIALAVRRRRRPLPTPAPAVPASLG